MAEPLSTASHSTTPQATPNSAPRILIIGAGARGHAYAAAISADQNSGILHAVAEPLTSKRRHLGQKYIWGDGSPRAGQQFSSWTDFIEYERDRRTRQNAGEATEPGVDAVFVCVLDGMHRDVVVAIGGLPGRKLSVMCEKPLATNLGDCVDMWDAVLGHGDDGGAKDDQQTEAVFSIGHVLRYTPHNMLLRKLLLEDRVIGDIMSVMHTEPVGWWHFAHSYVRGNWRKESITAPSLLTKCCHDIDLILWLLSSPTNEPPSSRHHPARVISTGALQYYHRGRKPLAAGTATNCLKCPIEKSCAHSAKRAYIDSEVGTASGNTDWPVHILVDDIEDITAKHGRAGAEAAVMAKLAEDYDASSMPQSEIDARPWFGRCVWESANDVCDDQFVTLSWEGEEAAAASDELTAPKAEQSTPRLPQSHDGPSTELHPPRDHVTRGPKTATIHMVAQTLKRCKRYTHIYGTNGELYADGNRIIVHSFDAVYDHPPPSTAASSSPPSPSSMTTTTYTPSASTGGHEGGDVGLAGQFVRAVDAVKNRGWSAARAQDTYIGCTLEDMVRSHAVVFAAEDARKGNCVIQFEDWWKEEVEELRKGSGSKRRDGVEDIEGRRRDLR